MARVELRNYRRAQSPLHTLFRLFRYFRHCRVLLICAVASILAYCGLHDRRVLLHAPADQSSEGKRHHAE